MYYEIYFDVHPGPGCCFMHTTIQRCNRTRWRLMRSTLYQYLHFLCERLLLFLREINRFLELLFECAYLKTPCFSNLDPRYSILDSCVSKHEHLETRESSFEDRVETVNLGGVYMRKLAPVRVSYRNDIVISYRVYMKG